MGDRRQDQETEDVIQETCDNRKATGNVDKKSETGGWRQDQETVDMRQEMRGRNMRPGT